MKVLLVSEGKHELAGSLETLVRRLSPRELEIDHDKVSREDVHAFHGQTQMYVRIAELVELSLLKQRCPRGFAPFAERVRQL